MKINKQHYATLRDAIIPLKDKIILHKQALIDGKGGKYKSLDRRLMWDSLWSARSQSLALRTVMGDYKEWSYNDDHTDTALRSIFKEMGI